MAATTTLYTNTLTNGSMVISAVQNVVRFTLLVKAGTVTVIGNALWNGLSSTPNTFSTGQGITLTAASVQNPLDGITIVAATTADIADVALSVQ